jgi:hypothetical protein
MTVILITLSLMAAVAVAVGILLLVDVAFRGTQPSQTSVPLPLLSGTSLGEWAAGQGRKLTEKWLQDHPGPVDAIGLAQTVEKTATQVVSRSFGLKPGETARSRLCRDQHATPQVTIPEALAIVTELNAEPGGVRRDVHRRVSENVSQASLKNRVATPLHCPLAGATGTCACSRSRPLVCRGRCVAGYDATPEIDDWAVTLGEGLAHGVSERLEAAGLDAGRYDLNEALARLLDDSDAGARWSGGERVLGVVEAEA